MKFLQKATLLLLVFSCVTLMRSNAQNLAVQMEQVNEIIPKIKLGTNELIKDMANLNSLTLKLEKKAAEITKIVGKPPAPVEKEERAPMVSPEQIEKIRGFEDNFIDFLARSKRDYESNLVNAFIPALQKIRDFGFYLQATLKSKFFREKVEAAMEGIERAEPDAVAEDEEEEELEEEPEEEMEVIEEMEEEEELPPVTPTPAPTPPTPAPEPEPEPAPEIPEPVLAPEPEPEITPEVSMEEMMPEEEEMVPEDVSPEALAKGEEMPEMEPVEDAPTEEELKSILDEEPSDVVDVPMEAMI